MPPTRNASRPLPGQRATGQAGPETPVATRSPEAVLRSLPSHGWTAGWTGRRDRALLVLRSPAGLSFDDIAALTVDDVVVTDGTAVIRVGAHEVMAQPEASSEPGSKPPVVLTMTDDCLLCAPCALSRWQHALDLADIHSDGRVVASVIGRAAPLTEHSPHVCDGPARKLESLAGKPMFPADERWTSAPENVRGGASSLPAQSRPTHDVRTRATSHGRTRLVANGYTRTEFARVDGKVAPPPTAAPIAPAAPLRPANVLENRVKSLLAGTA